MTHRLMEWDGHGQATQASGAPTARSSHAAAIVGHKAYVFGGEFEPRVPLDNDLHVFDLTTHQWSIATATGDRPSPRVGVAMTSIGPTIYVFAGRDQHHQELNEFYSFNTESGVWTLLSSGSTSPPHRSYHAIAAHEERRQVFTFGGCGKEGRLNDLWCYDINTSKWTQLPESSLTPRGGAGLVALHGHVWVLFGFCGHELTDVHRFNLDDQTWAEVHCTGAAPSGRSVFGTVAFGERIVMYGGEVDPSDQGHLGAGAFSGEVWVLDTEKRRWSGVGVAGQDPGARGWFAAAAFGGGMFVYGGNSDSNDRLDDVFVLSIEE